MSLKSILFCLFLYVCLVWVGASYFYSGSQVEHIGLLGTGAGLAAVLVLILLGRLFNWARVWRATRAARPKRETAGNPPLHEDDAALIALLDEAQATLNKMGAATNAPPLALSGLPVYLLLGPEGSGKTSTFLNAGLEPQLLAGQPLGSGPPAATRLCNIWFAQGRLFIEIAGRCFSGDEERWRQLLRRFGPQPIASRWRQSWNGPKPGLDVRAAVAFCDVKEFTAAASPQAAERLERLRQHWHDRLGWLAETLGYACPVYVLLTKCDVIPYFPDYFRRLPDAEIGQVLGCAVSHQPDATAEANAASLTKSFNALFYALADRRLTQLAREPDVTRRPAIYEFPREFKRLRQPLIQFLTGSFRPNPLRLSPQLCGYYLGGIGEKELEPALVFADTRHQWAEQSTSLDATVLFRPDATQILRGGADLGSPEKRGGRGLQRRWLFVSDLFRTVLPASPHSAPLPRVDRQNERRLRMACAAVCAACLLFCAVVLNSWLGNLRLLRSLRNSALVETHAAVPTLAQLQSLEDLRIQADRLVAYDRSGPPLGLRWGLYAGQNLLTPMKSAYFRRFQSLLLEPLNAALAGQLLALPVTPGPDASYAPIYRSLKTHLTISSGVCNADSALVTEVLEDTRDRIMPGQNAVWRSLADRQIAFYAGQLPFGNPCKLKEDIAARDRARQYLNNIQGTDRIYSGILAAAQKTFSKPQRLADLAPAYTEALSGPSEVAGVFSPDGLAYIEKASQGKHAGNPGDECVYGGRTGADLVSSFDHSGEAAIRSSFLRDYAEHWRNYLASFSVQHYRGTADAAHKLEILSGHKSPLLALFAMASNQTNFIVSTPDPGVVTPMVKRMFPSLASKTQLPVSLPKKPSSNADSFSRPTDITKAFQPVHLVVPPGSETWVVDKNTAYVDALAALGRSMLEISRAGSAPATDQAGLYQAASQNYDKALDAARQLARNFEPVGVGGLDVTIERLLEAPIRQTQGYIVTDPEGVAAGQANGQLHSLCERLRVTLRKYPFAPAGQDATLEEVAGLFAPNSGAIWKFQAQSLNELVVKEDKRWKAKDPAKRPQAAPEMLTFLNRAQSLSDALYPNGSTQSQLTYILRPKLDPAFKDAIVEFQMDGAMHSWTSSLQKQFSWPAPPGSKELGVKGSIRIGSVSFPFTSRGGVWAIFRVMGDAEPRALSNRIVEWREVRGGDGRIEQIQPAPVRLEFVEFPGGVDLFNPKFFQDLQCPAKAVQK